MICEYVVNEMNGLVQGKNEVKNAMRQTIQPRCVPDILQVQRMLRCWRLNAWRLNFKSTRYLKNTRAKKRR